MRRTILGKACVAVTTVAALAAAVAPAAATVVPVAAPAPVGVPAAPAAPLPPSTLAAASADRLIASAVASPTLRLGQDDALSRTSVVAGTRGLQYVTYARSYQGLPVIGGDVVVTTDVAGAVRGTAAARSAEIGVATTPRITAEAAVSTSRAKLVSVDSSTDATLTVLAGTTPKLVWETVVSGRAAANRPSVLHVFVDALTGKIVQTSDDVREGTGNGFYNGKVTIGTSGSGSSFSMTDATRPGLKCSGQNGTALAGTDDVWGTGSGTNLETACVDALYAVQMESDMLRDWLGRPSVSGDGTTPPIRVGLPEVNAYWNGTYANFGRNQANTRQATPIDVVGHELGHAIFQETPGGAGFSNENGGLNEATGDIFGALTEAYADNPLDPPDYTVGEEVDLVGAGPIRYMHDPSLAGDPNCYSTANVTTEVHAAAGPLNHWFYLTAEGSAPVGKPASPTCDSSKVTGLGIRKAGEIFYNALLAKTSTWKYVDVRVATLNAAKNLYPGSCAEFAVVKAAWQAIELPAQPGEPTCGTATGDSGVTCSGTNRAATAIPDAGAAVTSEIAISGCGRKAAASSTAAVSIAHTFRGDLVIDLVAPDGSAYRMKSSSGADGVDNVDTSYRANLAGEPANGVWKLRVRDVYARDSGRIKSWSLTL